MNKKNIEVKFTNLSGNYWIFFLMQMRFVLRIESEFFLGYEMFYQWRCILTVFSYCIYRYELFFQFDSKLILKWYIELSKVIDMLFYNIIYFMCKKILFITFYINIWYVRTFETKDNYIYETGTVTGIPSGAFH